MDASYTILLVDDEPLARHSFRKLIERAFPEFSIIGEAATGPESLQRFRSIKPDIVIMDICIPEINGLEASRLILEEAPYTQIIILSAFDHFDYAQDAINSGILGYLLKPVQETKLEKLLLKSIQNIRSKRQHSEQYKQLQSYRDIAIGDMVTSFIYGSWGGLSSSFYAQQISPRILQGYFCLFQIEGGEELEDHTRDKIYAFVSNFQHCYYSRLINNTLPVFIQAQKTDPHLYQEINSRIALITGKTVHHGVGTVKNNPELFPESFREATGQLFHQQPEKRKINYPRDLEARLFCALKTSDWSLAIQHLNRFFELLSHPDGNLCDCRLILFELLIQLRRYMDDQGNPDGSTLLNHLLEELPLHQDRLFLLSWIASPLLNLLELEQNSTSVEDLHIKKILQYIDLHDFSIVSLEAVAEAVSLSPQYVSKLFKVHYKMNFIDYLIRRRMSFASRLLTETKLPIRDIADRSGYSDVAYFSKIFKKYAGQSPRDYRKYY